MSQRCSLCSGFMKLIIIFGNYLELPGRNNYRIKILRDFLKFFSEILLFQNCYSESFNIKKLSEIFARNFLPKSVVIIDNFCTVSARFKRRSFRKIFERLSRVLVFQQAPESEHLQGVIISAGIVSRSVSVCECDGTIS